jgi:hypothetical protein
MVVTNSAGVTVENITQTMPDLYSIPYTNQLQGFTSYMGWNARNRTNDTAIAPGEYSLMLSAKVDGHLLSVRGTIWVVQGVVYTVNATFVSRFCSNSSAIPKRFTNGSGASAGLTFGSESGFGWVGSSDIGTGIKNVGSVPVSIQAVCIDAVGTVPANNTVMGAVANTLQFSISPNTLVQPGQEANLSARFTGGSRIYVMMQYYGNGVGITIIASDGSSLRQRTIVTEITTASSPTNLISILNVRLEPGNNSSPVLSAVLAFDASTGPVTQVDIFVNGTYIGTAGVGHDTTSPSAPRLYYVYYNIRVIEPGRISIVHGARYAITFVATTRGFTETSASITVVARP